ncbi:MULTISPECIES: outer membrane beta-barrel protein [Ramlibacter]|uniref:Outer membrane beta-barrel protein n=1 Tax=Ramlibacter pinisoli TaxID=2682844 RepID=A0A6N8J0K4_9BURK|nr:MULTISPECIES: outer membrane beta-barrel protein [Ramlibacter]MBA2962695.1 outer membrane beta-barrel protein [Ramlibacter sp. CGMCC 1.13660]MVQ32637.1 outer membrane beta-barrel protein [Ramlibacter pinisoli]
MKAASILGVALLALVGTAQAQTTASRMGLQAGRMYGEVGYTYMDFRGTTNGVSFSGHPGILRGIVGYDFHPNFAAEGMLGFGVHNADINVAGGAIQGESKIQSTFGLFGKAKWETPQYEVFGRLGYAWTRVNTDIRTATFSTGSTSDNANDVAYGIGANWKFTQSGYTGYLGVDVMRYSDKSTARLDGITVSLGTKF